MMVFSAFIGMQFHLKFSRADEWKFVSPCTESQEMVAVTSFEKNISIPEKKGFFRREELMRRLIRAAKDSTEDLRREKWF